MVAPKDKTEKMDKIGLIYHINIKYDNCEMDYIGETERRAIDKFPEHHCKCMIGKSQMANCVHYNNHSISHQTCEIVERESDWYRRGIKDAIYTIARTPTLNRDQDPHHPTNTWNCLSWEINNINSPSMHLQLISCDQDGRWSLKADKN